MSFIKKILNLPLDFVKALLDLFKKIFNPSNLFHLDNVASTLLIFLFLWSIGKIQISVLDPLGDALADVELSDIFYSQMGKNENYRLNNSGNTILDTNVVLVNVGFLPRSGYGRDPGIAEMMQIINSGEPKVVGLDVFFRSNKNPIQDTLLAMSFATTKNLVLVSEGNDYEIEKEAFKSYTTSINYFNQFADNGLANMVLENASGERDLKVCRRFMPYGEITELDTILPTFAVKLCELYLPESLEKLKKRKNHEELINYFGNIAVAPVWLPDFYEINNLPKPFYRAFEHTQVFHKEFDPIVFKDKIVILGFMGERLDKDEGTDKFFTPLNEKYVGKANKDMYGVVVHANIISTILSGKYITTTANWFMHIIGVLAVFLTFASFRPIYNDYKIWYDGVTKVLALIISIIIIGIQGYFFWYYEYIIKFGAIYFACIILSGDFLEVYYGLIKNLFRKIIDK